MNTNKHITKVYLSLRGDFSTQEAILELNIQPSFSLNKGDFNSGGRESKFSIFNYVIFEGNIIDLYSICDEYKIFVSSIMGNLSKFIKKYKISSRLVFVMKLNADSKNSLPALGFDNEMIELLHETNTEIDIDLHIRG